MKTTLFVIATLLAMSSVSADYETCVPTSVGLTAHFVNEVPEDPLEITCDIGIFFDEDGTIENAELLGTLDGALSVQFGIYVNDANVNVKDSSIEVVDDYPHQFVGITYREGASGVIADNAITGFHRAGMVIRGEGTDVTIKGNEVRGVGPKTTGWAENGIQIDSGATATVIDNVIADHWWNGLSNYASTGLLVFGSDDVTAMRNSLVDNEFSAYLDGANNNLVNNVVEITNEEPGLYAYGVVVTGERNGVRQNEFVSEVDAAYLGIYLYPGAQKTKLIRNDFSGWEYGVYDGGLDTVWPKPFQ